MKTTIRVTMRNNSDARRCEILRGLAQCRHNGGKVIIAKCDKSDLEEVQDSLESDNSVDSFEVL